MWKRSSSVLIAVLFGLATHAAELTADEKAVWDLENAYWEYVKANDIPGYRSLWDERFVGWPDFSEMPLGKAKIHEWVTELHSKPGTHVDYDLKMAAVRAYGDVVAAHYLARYSARSDATGEVVGNEVVARITHTWQRQGNTWRIVTGMSGTWIGESGE